MQSAEQQRLESSGQHHIHPWKKWGPFVSERAWGTVREDYSPNGKAWDYSTHDMSRSKAYRWSEDGLAGFSDQFQFLCFSLALWNGQDPILKERLFGLNSTEGNHGEDVKEYYYYLDATPTYSYCKYLYKYPHQAFPYETLVDVNNKRTTLDREFELIDTGVFADNRYFDVFVEYAKEDINDICIRIQVFNRGPDPANIHVLPQLWFRNTWSWGSTLGHIPSIEMGTSQKDFVSLYADSSKIASPSHLSFEYKLPPLYFYGESGGTPLFTHNESNNKRLWGSEATNRTPYVKDAFHRYLINKEVCVSPDKSGSKACLHYGELTIPPGESKTIRLRLAPQVLQHPLKDVDAIIAKRKLEADEYYAEIQSTKLSEEDKQIHRQSIAGLLWSMQFYNYNVKTWLTGDDPAHPPAPSRRHVRNSHWEHLFSCNIISMPDKWEYPWFASWDLAFHTLTMALVDLEGAKHQLFSLLTHQYQHPNGQIPAYEWAFSDLNPPVQAWAAWRLYQIEQRKKQKGDRNFLESCFLKLIHNFGWWVNKVDKEGNNFFEGGFLGLDNISVIDRSKPCPLGGHIEQSDGTGWMGFFSLMMMRIALELAKDDSTYEGMATTFFEHFAYIAKAMQTSEARLVNMWDEDDGFFYDVVSHPDGTHQRLKIRSYVGIIPFFSIDYLDFDEISKFTHFHSNLHLFRRNNPDIVDLCMTPYDHNGKKRFLLSLMRPNQIQSVLERAWNPNEFRSSYGLRSLSKYHEENPLIFIDNKVSYEPGESLEKIKGGNSNWRGPVWFPINFLTLDALHKLSEAIGDKIKINIPGESPITVKMMEESLAQNLIDLFRKNTQGQRPIHADNQLYATDPHWQDLILFYEHYHGDTGRGLGASHQSGWSSIVANLIAIYGSK